MKFYFYAFAFVLSGCLSKNNLVQDKDSTSSIAKQEQDLKDAAMCRCAYEVLYLTKEERIKDGSLSGYTQISDAPLDSFEKLDSLITTYLDTAAYFSAVNAELGMMKCIDFYNSAQLDDFVKRHIGN